MFQESRQHSVPSVGYLRKCISRGARACFFAATVSIGSLAAADPLPAVQLNGMDRVTAQILTVDVNSADAEELAEVLVGVGEAKATAIVNYRNQNGPFKAAEDLLQVKGIGDATLANNRDRMRF